MEPRPIISMILTFVLLLVISLSGCEKINQMLPSDTISTVKVGVIQPSGLAPSFTKGAELAKSQINNSSGLLGMHVEFIVMDNQGTRDFPDVD